MNVFPQSDDCGPIEAARNWTRLTRPTAFPQSDDCGPIEAGNQLVLRQGIPLRFRSLTTAAPLKLGAEAYDPVVVVAFPQSDDCGPIEAPQPWLTANNCAAFPQSDDCGPIEAAGIGRWVSALSPFPQSDDCGPIEAFVSVES